MILIAKNARTHLQHERAASWACVGNLASAVTQGKTWALALLYQAPVLAGHRSRGWAAGQASLASEPRWAHLQSPPPPPPAKPCSPSVITRGRSHPGPHGEVASRERTPTCGRQATHRDLRGGVVMWGVGDRPAQLPGAPAWDVGTDPEVLLGVLVPRRPLLQAPPLGACP